MKLLLSLLAFFKKLRLAYSPNRKNIEATICDGFLPSCMKLPDELMGIRMFNIELPNGEHHHFHLSDKYRQMWKKLNIGTRILVEERDNRFATKYVFKGLAPT